MADLTPDLQVCLSWGSIAESFCSLQSFSVSCFHVILGLPGPCFPSTCMSKTVLTAPLECSTCPYQQSLLSFRMRFRSSMPSRASSSLDLMVTKSCGLTLQICLIIALSFCCRHWRFGFVSGQVSLAWSIVLHTQELYTWPQVLKERWREERTGSSSFNFFQAVFTCCGWNLLPLVAESMSPRQPKEATTSSFSGPLWSAIQGACSSLAPCISIIRVLCQALEPTAFLVHPVLAAIAEDAVAANSSATDGALKLAWTLQEVQARTTDHDLHLSCIYSQSFFLHCFFPSQEPLDTFLEWFNDDNKVIGIEVLPGDPRVELMRQCFKHNDEEQWAEYRALVNTDLHFKLFTVPLTTQTAYWHTSPAPAHIRWPSEALDQMPSQGLWKQCWVSCWQLDTSLAAAWQQRLHLLCLYLGWSQTGNCQLTPSDEAVHNPLQNFHDLLCQLETAVVAPFQWITLTLVEADNETLLQVGGYLAIANDCSCEITDQGGASITGCLYYLHHYAWWAQCFARLDLRDSLLNHINGDWDGRAFHWWFVTQMVWVPVKPNTEKPLVVL